MDVCKWEAVLYSALQIINHEVGVVAGPLSCDVLVPGGIKMVCTCYLWCWLLEIKYYCWSRKCCDTQSVCLCRAAWTPSPCSFVTLRPRVKRPTSAPVGHVMEIYSSSLIIHWHIPLILSHVSRELMATARRLNVSHPMTWTTFCFCL